MESPTAGDVSRLLSAWQEGDEAALERLVPLVYAQLHEIAGRYMRDEGSAETLQTTALVHEAYLRLLGADVEWEGRRHFLAIAARTMRRVLVDHARARKAAKRGGDRVAITLNEAMAGRQTDITDVLAIDTALRQLAEEDERKARAVELHYFGGLTYEEIADVLDISAATVHRDLRFATSWLRARLASE